MVLVSNGMHGICVTLNARDREADPPPTPAAPGTQPNPTNAVQLTKDEVEVARLFLVHGCVFIDALNSKTRTTAEAVIAKLEALGAGGTP